MGIGAAAGAGAAGAAAAAGTAGGVSAGALAAGAAGLSAAGSIAGSALSSGAAGSAASTQAQAANTASADQLAQYQQTANALSPFTAFGTSVIPSLDGQFQQYADIPTNYTGDAEQATGVAEGQLSGASGAAASQGSALGQQNYLLGTAANAATGQQSALGQQNYLLGMQGSAVNAANNLLSGDPTQVQAYLSQLPGYQFTQSQGLESTQNAAAARGLGVSGAALKGAATYSTGLANQTYNSQLQDLQNQAGVTGNAASGYASNASGYGALGSTLDNVATGYGANALGYGQQGSGYDALASGYGGIGQDYLGINTALQGNTTNSFNRLLSSAQLGESAAATTGEQGITATNAANNYATSGAAANAAGQVGSANALTSGLSGVGSSASSGLGNYLLYNQLFGTQAGTGSGGVTMTPGVSSGLFNSNLLFNASPSTTSYLTS